jgi:TRAP-type mannitol/chloroaromatic compound transport system substrate-binding protein
MKGLLKKIFLNSRVNMSKYDKEVFTALKYFILFGVIAGFAALGIASVIMFDTYYIEKNPKFFLTETLLFGIMTAIPIAYLSYMRGSTSYKKIFQDAMIFFVKIVLMHLGFQLSGIYSVFFPASANPAATFST